MASVPAMTTATVYFATNRQRDALAPGGFGADIVDPADPQAVTYAVVPVTGINLDDASSGTLGAITGLEPGDFPSTVIAEIETTGKNLLLFIHGFDNSFEDAIKRAAYNRTWFASSGLAAADTTVVAFTWPSAGTLIANLPNAPDDAYLADLAMASRSAIHVAAFLKNILTIVATVQRSGKRAFLLAHSMGNHALASAIPQLAGSVPTALCPVFDEAILAAADDVNTTFAAAGTGMNPLATLANRISVYSSLRDIAMDLSMAVNKNVRLGYSGPVDKSTFPGDRFRSVDCTEVFDFFGLVPPDATHQYYRRSRTVRADIVNLMAGQPVNPGVSSLSALPLAG
jgi:esterase/lipase superfamily enzyme